MVKAPKHRRIKRATVLIKRTHCIRNTKNKSYSPLYQKLKVNNHSLARALSQEKQESQLLFTKNVELLAEVQDLIHACNNRDLVISNVVQNAKDMLQMLVKMSGFLTNTLSSCQEFVSSQVNVHRTSTSSTGRRESTRRLSTKSPARGVVKPMVSGHTITKPTINLSRVNMQRLQNVNLSIIEEGPTTPERNLDRSESRRSRSMPERLPVSTLRTEDDEERVIINRRTNRYSGGRLSSGRYSKRNSGRLSGSGVAGRLSKRSAEYLELLKSPRVTLQDVSRYLTNNQSVNIRTLSESTSQLNNTASPDDSQIMEEQSSPENSNLAAIIPETQESCETSESERESSNGETLTTTRKSSVVPMAPKRKSFKKSKIQHSPSLQSPIIESQYIDPLEGSSWMHNSSISTSDEQELNTGVLESGENLTEEDNEHMSSPVSSFAANRRRTSNYFRVPDLPKVFSKPSVSRIKFKDEYQSPSSETNDLDVSNGFLDNDDEDDHRVNLRYITKRRGPSSKTSNVNDNDGDDDDDDDDDDETLMLNMRRQLNQTTSQPPEQPERLQFDVNELLQLTPLKPLLSMTGRINNGLAPVEVEPESTTTIQITQRFQKPAENTEVLSRMSRIQQPAPPDLPTPTVLRTQEPMIGAPERRISELTTTRVSSRIELPRLTDMLNSSEENQEHTLIDTPEINNYVNNNNHNSSSSNNSNHNNKHLEKRKKMVLKSIGEANIPSDNEDESPVQKKKPKQRKKKQKDKDPSTAKVVLQKLNNMLPGSSTQTESVRSDRKNSDESVSSTRSSVFSRVDPSSDSESSTASFNSKQILMRPRREGVPKNLREPSLRRKMRR